MLDTLKNEGTKNFDKKKDIEPFRASSSHSSSTFQRKLRITRLKTSLWPIQTWKRRVLRSMRKLGVAVVFDEGKQEESFLDADTFSSHDVAAVRRAFGARLKSLRRSMNVADYLDHCELRFHLDADGHSLADNWQLFSRCINAAIELPELAGAHVHILQCLRTSRTMNSLGPGFLNSAYVRNSLLRCKQCN